MGWDKLSFWYSAIFSVEWCMMVSQLWAWLAYDAAALPPSWQIVDCSLYHLSSASLSMQRPWGGGSHWEDISKYMKFSDGEHSANWTVQCYTNNKPWITSHLKALHKRKRALRSGHQREEESTAWTGNLQEEAGGWTKKTSVRNVWIGTLLVPDKRQSSGSLEKATKLDSIQHCSHRVLKFDLKDLITSGQP